MKVLIVEDQLPVAEQIARFVKPYFSEVLVAQTFFQATEYLKTEHSHFDLITLDLSLPDSPVKQTIEAIRGIKKSHKETIVVVITGMSDPELQRLVTEQGADAFLEKQHSVLSESIFNTNLRDIFSSAIKKPEYKKSVDVLAKTIEMMTETYKSQSS